MSHHPFSRGYGSGGRGICKASLVSKLPRWYSRSTEYSGAKSTLQQLRRTATPGSTIPPFPRKQGDDPEKLTPGPRACPVMASSPRGPASQPRPTPLERLPPVPAETGSPSSRRAKPCLGRRKRWREKIPSHQVFHPPGRHRRQADRQSPTFQPGPRILQRFPPS